MIKDMCLKTEMFMLWLEKKVCLKEELTKFKKPSLLKPTSHDDPGDPPFNNAKYHQKKAEYLTTFCYILCTSVTENLQYLLFFSPRPS